VPSDSFSFFRLAEGKWDGTEPVPPLGKPIQMPLVRPILRPIEACGPRHLFFFSGGRHETDMLLLLEKRGN